MPRFVVALVCAPIIVVDSATFWSTAYLFRGFEPTVVAYLLALALVSIQTGSLLLAGQPAIRASVRNKLGVGVALLMSLTAIANVAEAYERGSHAFHAADIAAAFGFGASPSLFTIIMAWVCGAVLVAVAYVYWSAVADYIQGFISEQSKKESRGDETINEVYEMRMKKAYEEGG